VNKSFSKNSLHACLRVSGPSRELWIASLGCLIGSTLLILAIQLYQDATTFLHESEGPKNYFTLNKKVEGGALVNLGKNEQSFTPEELEKIKSLKGVKRIGGFTRNQFPLSLYIWPSGKVGLGAAAKTDLFFESIPDEFLDFIPKEWHWDENSSLIPIMVPKFYLDLWNFGLAPSRIEYPALSTQAATGMPIQLFIGKRRETILEGRFVAFSKRINSVLVPANFLQWANTQFGQPEANDFVFLWKNGSIEGPPITRSSIPGLQGEPDFKDWEISPLENPAERIPAPQAILNKKKASGPSRIILEIAENPSIEFLDHIKEKGYEINREFPEQDLVKKAIHVVFLGMIGIGALLSFLSIATFAASFRLVVSRASEQAKNLLLLGFSQAQVSQVFFDRFLRIFLIILSLSFFASYASKVFLINQARFLDPSLSVDSGINLNTLIFLAAYGILYLVVNKRVIEKSVHDLMK
jgi:hypothetical protein